MLKTTKDFAHRVKYLSCFKDNGLLCYHHSSCDIYCTPALFKPFKSATCCRTANWNGKALSRCFRWACSTAIQYLLTAETQQKAQLRPRRPFPSLFISIFLFFHCIGHPRNKTSSGSLFRSLQHVKNNEVSEYVLQTDDNCGLPPTFKYI